MMNVVPYIRGNLAVDQKTKPSAMHPERNPAPSPRSLPMQEKLLYLFTVVVCVAVACAVIWRYAQIYEMNVQIHNIENRISQLEAENSKLKMEISKLQSPQRLIDEAKKRGFEPVAENQITRIPAKSDAGGQDGRLAMKP